MRHQRHVIGIVPAQVGQVVAVVLALRETLFEPRQATGHGISSHVDDPGVGQDEMDQAYVHEIIGKFVDEMGPVRLAVKAGPREVLLPQVRERRPVDAGNRGGITGRAGGRRSGQPRGQDRQIGKFGSPLHRGMAGQHLLDQGRSGPGQADHEDRVRRLGAHARARGEELRREGRNGAPDIVVIGVGVVGRGGAAQGGASPVVLERVLEPRFILQRLGQGEMQVRAIVRPRQAPVQQLAHRRDVDAREPDDLQIGQAPIGFAEAGLEGETSPIGRDAVILAAQGF